LPAIAVCQSPAMFQDQRLREQARLPPVLYLSEMLE